MSCCDPIPTFVCTHYVTFAHICKRYSTVGNAGLAVRPSFVSLFALMLRRRRDAVALRALSPDT
eukprot:1184894-Prorocentrum_minimum.AAC.3